MVQLSYNNTYFTHQSFHTLSTLLPYSYLHSPSDHSLAQFNITTSHQSNSFLSYYTENFPPILPPLLFLSFITPSVYIYMGWGESGFNCWGVQWPASMLFLFYGNVSGMQPRSHLSSQPLTIPAPWVLLHIRWSIPLFKWFHPG